MLAMAPSEYKTKLVNTPTSNTTSGETPKIVLHPKHREDPAGDYSTSHSSATGHAAPTEPAAGTKADTDAREKFAKLLNLHLLPREPEGRSSLPPNTRPYNRAPYTLSHPKPLNPYALNMQH